MSNTKLEGRYLHVELNPWPAGAIKKWPAPSSSNRPKTDELSKRGRHNQSTDPAAVTSAAEPQSESGRVAAAERRS